jgi:two-component system sensor histidine kinase UhpB
MVAQLAVMAERNRLLGDQLTTLQEEERVEIARDLHDEIGAHLFAVNMDAKMIAKTGENDPAIVELAGSVQTAVGHMQRHVRDLLLRLRPTRVIELGLETALRDLIRHWSARRPEIAFRLRMDPGGEPGSDQVAEVIYRVVQEALNNAVRHSRPNGIDVVVRPENEDLRVEIDDDGEAGGSQAAAGGLGLIGMRERVAGCGGRLTFGPRRHAAGWRVAAQLPRTIPAGGPAPDASSHHGRAAETVL